MPSPPGRSDGYRPPRWPDRCRGTTGGVGRPCGSARREVSRWWSTPTEGAGGRRASTPGGRVPFGVVRPEPARRRGWGGRGCSGMGDPFGIGARGRGAEPWASGDRELLPIADRAADRGSRSGRVLGGRWGRADGAGPLADGAARVGAEARLRGRWDRVALAQRGGGSDGGPRAAGLRVRELPGARELHGRQRLLLEPRGRARPRRGTASTRHSARRASPGPGRRATMPGRPPPPAAGRPGPRAIAGISGAAPSRRTGGRPAPPRSVRPP